MSLCGDKSCVPYAIKIQNYARQTEVEEVHTLPEMRTTEARSLSFLSLIYWIWSINPELPKPENSWIYTSNISLVCNDVIKLTCTIKDDKNGENKQQEQQVFCLLQFEFGVVGSLHWPKIAAKSRRCQVEVRMDVLRRWKGIFLYTCGSVYLGIHVDIRYWISQEIILSLLSLSSTCGACRKYIHDEI